MKQFLLSGVLMLALVGGASGQSFTNASTLNAPPQSFPQIDATNFVNLAPFNIQFPLGFNFPFDFSDVQTFTNRSSMTSTTGFTFDTAPSNSGARQAAASFGNAGQGMISSGSATNGITLGLVFPYVGFVGIDEFDLPVLDIEATNIVNAGLLDVGLAGVLTIGGNHIDLSKGSLHVEGSDEVTLSGLFSGSGAISNLIGTNIIIGAFAPNSLGIFNNFEGIGLQTNQLSIPFNFRLPNAMSPASIVTNIAGLQTDLIVTPPNATPFVFTNMVDSSNTTYQVVFINTNLPGIATDVRLQGGGAFFGTPVIQWSAVITNTSGAPTATNFLYLSDAFGSFQTNFLVTNSFTLSGVPLLAPFNYTFNRSFIGYTNLALTNAQYDAQAIFGTAFPATNAYSALEVNVQPVTFAPDVSAAASTLTNLPGRMAISATNWLDLTRAKITGANYLNLVASNHFVGSSNAQIVIPNMDINVGSTNGMLAISNLVSSSVPRFTGIIDMWSGRWTNVLVTTVAGTNFYLTNTYHVLIVNSGLSPTAPVNVLNFAAASTNTATLAPGNVFISDVLDITNTLLIKSQNLTITTNAPGSQNSTGQLNLLSPDLVWSASLPILQNLTNWGVINIAGTADFDGNRQPPYYTTSFGEPYLSFVNHGLIITEGNNVSANYFENSSSGIGVFQFGALSFTNSTFGALLYSAAGPITMQAGTALLTNDTILAANGDVTLNTGNLTAIGHSFQASGSLTLSVSGTLNDGGAVSSNFWFLTNGISLLVKPTTGDFLGTTVTLNAPAGQEVFDVWAGLDVGLSAAGFVNNGALGHLILDGGDDLSQFFFGGLEGTTNYALYVDQLELRDGATNRSTVGGTQNFTAFDLAPNFKIYYADAIIGGNDISEKLQQGNNGQLIWVPAFAGIFSGTNFVSSDGKTNFFNRALVQSGDIDSNGNGIANAFDHSPIYTADNINLAINVANSATNAATRIATITWAGLANSTNYLYYASNLLSTNWVQVFSTNQGPANGTITVKRTNSTGFYRVQVNPSQP